MTSELFQTYCDILPGYELVAHKEVAIPYYKYTCHFLYSEERGLPVLQEYVLEFLKLHLSLNKISSLLGIDIQVVTDSFYHLVQRELIDIRSNLTEAGNEYLETHSLDFLEKGEIEILVNSFTGYIDANVKSGMLRKDAKSFDCYKAYITHFEPDDLDFRAMEGVLKTYCEQNDINSNCRLIEVVDLAKANTMYRRLDVLVYQNQSSEYRIMTVENNKRVLKYEDLLLGMDMNGYDLLPFNGGDYFEQNQVKKIYDLFNNCSDIKDSDFYDVLSRAESPVIVLPLTEISYFSNYTLEEIKNVLSKGTNVSVYICGNKYIKPHQEDFVSSLLKLRREHEKLICIHIPSYLPLMCFSGQDGCIQIQKKHELALQTTKVGIVSQFVSLTKDDIERIINIAPDIATREISYNFEPLSLPDMAAFERIWLDFGRIFEVEFNHPLFRDGSIQNRSTIVSMNPARNRETLTSLLISLNGSFFEEIKTVGVRDLNDRNFFWKKFKYKYPDLFRAVDKLRVYRNYVGHSQLNESNEKKFFEYLKEDTGGVLLEFIPKGYEYIQSKLLNEVFISLREILSRSK